MWLQCAGSLKDHAERVQALRGAGFDVQKTDAVVKIADTAQSDAAASVNDQLTKLTQALESSQAQLRAGLESSQAQLRAELVQTAARLESGQVRLESRLTVFAVVFVAVLIGFVAPLDQGYVGRLLTRLIP